MLINLTLSIDEFDSDATDAIISSGQSPHDFSPLLESESISDEIKNLIFQDLINFSFDLKRYFLEINQERLIS